MDISAQWASEAKALRHLQVQENCHALGMYWFFIFGKGSTHFPTHLAVRVTAASSFLFEIFVRCSPSVHDLKC